jgi:hypothetical protein
MFADIPELARACAAHAALRRRFLGHVCRRKCAHAEVAREERTTRYQVAHAFRPGGSNTSPRGGAVSQGYGRFQIRGLGPAPGRPGAGREGAGGDDVAQLSETGVARNRDRSRLDQLRAGVGLRDGLRRRQARAPRAPHSPVHHLGRTHDDVEDVGRFVGVSCDIARSSAGPTASYPAHCDLQLPLGMSSRFESSREKAVPSR